MLENPGTSHGTQNPAEMKSTTANAVKIALMPRKNPQALRAKVISSSVASKGTSTCVNELLTTMRINCGTAMPANKASVWIPTPS